MSIKLTPWGAAMPIPGFPWYLATECGHIVSESNWRRWGLRLIVPVTSRDGYLKVRLQDNGRRRKLPVHRLVAEAWLHPRPSPSHQIRHLDGNPLNNAATNIAWGTAKDNADDRERHGRTARGEKMSSALRAAREARRAG